MKIEKEVAFFDTFAAEHGDYDVLGRHAYTKLLRILAARVPLGLGNRVADLGCGSGAFTRRVAQLTGADVLGIDISPGLVAAARSQAGVERYIVGDIMTTGLDASSFDAVTYSGVLHHFDNRDLRIRVLREGCRILRSGGKVFSFDPSWHSPSMWLYRDPASPLCSTAGKTENEVLLRREQLLDEARSAGLCDVEVFGVSGITFRFVAGRIARLILPLYNIYERLVELSPWERCIGTFLVMIGTKGST